MKYQYIKNLFLVLRPSLDPDPQGDKSWIRINADSKHGFLGSVVDPDPHGSASLLVTWIRIRIRISIN
jgi:hypothetical protein